MKQPRLTEKAGIFLLKDSELVSAVAVLCGIRVTGMVSAISRRSSSLTTYKAIMLISERMKVDPLSIIEEKY